MLECIVVWATWYPGTSFEETYQVLVDLQVSFPKKFSYFKPEELDPLVKTSKISQNQEEFKENSNKKESNRSNHTNNGKNDENNNKFNELIGEIQVSSQNLENIQEILVVLLSNHPEENEIKADLQEVMDNFKKVKGKHQALCREIENSSNPQLETQFLPKLMDEIEVIDTILLEFEKYSSKRLTFKAFRFEFTQFDENEKNDRKAFETPEEAFSQEFKKNQDLEQIREEEIQSKVGSVHSASMRGGDFEEKAFQNEVFSNIKDFNEHRKKYLYFAKSDSM